MQLFPLSRTPFRSTALSLAAGLLMVAVAPAQKVIRLNGSIYDGAGGGPFVFPNVYVITNRPLCCGVVPAGKTLTIKKGAIVKFQNTKLTVLGTLNATQAVFTSEKDDGFGGDTNGDGAKTLPARGDWQHIICGNKGTGTLDRCRFRFGGLGGATIVNGNKVGFKIDGCLVEESGGPGIWGGWSDGQISNCEIKNCNGVAIGNWAFDRIENLHRNKASKCLGGDYVVVENRINVPWPKKTLTMKADQTMNNNGIFVMKSTAVLPFVVPRDHTLVVTAGSILKFRKGSAVSVSGNLQVQGTSSSPVKFTSLADDAGGDTNKNGNASVPKPGDWEGIALRRYSGASVLAHATIAYGGRANGPGQVVIDQASPTFKNSTITQSPTHGVSIGNTKTTFADCNFTNNGGVAVTDMSWDSVARCSGNQASGNRWGDYFRINHTTSSANSTLDIRPTNYPGLALVIGGWTSLGAGSRLTLHEGVVVKATGNGRFNIGTSFSCLGTGKNPVKITSIHDDSIGGDTNKNGNATRPQAGDWSHISFTAPAAGTIQHTLVRYAGRSKNQAVFLAGKNVTLDCVRVEHCGGVGMFMWDHKGPLNNAVVYKAGGVGIEIGGGSFDLVHATVSECMAAGIRAHKNISIKNCISWNNTGANYANVTEKNVQDSNGAFAGKNGNIDIDPKFQNPAVGDLHLSANSPCLGKAGMAAALATKKDHDEQSRILDHSLKGVALPDMGAFERGNYTLKTTGQPALGQTITMSVQGPPGPSKVFVGGLNGQAMVQPFGMALLGTFPIIPIGAGPVGRSLKITIPKLTSLIGVRVGFQGIATTQNNAQHGGVTGLWRIEVVAVTKR